MHVCLYPSTPALRTVARIFYSLNWITIPEFFEDHQAQWMEGWHYFLGYACSCVFGLLVIVPLTMTMAMTCLQVLQPRGGGQGGGG